MQYIICLIILLISTVSVLILNPVLQKNIKITNSNTVLNPQSAYSTGDINLELHEIENKNININKTNVETEKKNIKTTETQAEQKNLDNARAEYMKKMKERAENEYGYDYINKTDSEIIFSEYEETFDNPEKSSRKVLTEQEEILAWNKWHSDIANELILRARERARAGTLNLQLSTTTTFSFTVNYRGEISCISIDSVTPGSEFTNASKVYKEIIKSINHHPVLKFPEGTHRKTNKFKLGIVIVRQPSGLTSPSDFHDYEKIKTYSQSQI